MNRLSTERRAQILRCLVEGNSIRSTVRITGAAKNTVTKLLVDVGTACSEFQDQKLRNLTCRRIQCNEIWSFCYAKKTNVPKEKRGVFGYGDVWTWTAICADSKLVPSWMVGRRDAWAARLFLKDLYSRLSHKVQMTSDGHWVYLDAVADEFGTDVDYAMLVKIYGTPPHEEGRYSPYQIIDTKKKVVTGKPSLKHVSTSFVERQNLTMRMCMRRFTRLTNAFSKKVENLTHAVSLHFMYYNFCRIHKTLRVTPAMEAGVVNRLWSLRDIVGLIDKGY